MRPLLCAVAISVALLRTGWATACAQQTEVISINASAPSHPFPHFWEEVFGSGRAILTLRESYRDDLRAVREVTGFRYVRFHAILHDEVGVYTEDEHGNPTYNFTYVDQIYDGLLKNGVRPFVEISFMPKKLAFNPDALHPFWYKPNVSPPKSIERWDALIQAFAAHLVARYGIDEVAQWYFEVWNEPNIDFWNGIPRQRSYFDLYDHTARVLKAVSPRLRVGGPATAAAEWIPAFLAHAAATHTPVDFVSSHGYADDTVENLFGTHEEIAMDDRVCRAIAKVRTEIDHSPLPHTPLFWTEWNVRGDHQLRDTAFVGPALAHTVAGCDGLVNEMSFWTFSDVFEEGGPAPEPFEGSFGLRAVSGISKPSFYDFALLHQLGTERYANTSPDALVTRRKDGALAIAVWNLVDPEAPAAGKAITLDIHGVAANAALTLQRVDASHGNPLPAYLAMGSPRYPTHAQVEQLNQASALPPPTLAHLKGTQLHLELQPNALALIILPR